jgi:type II secretory pathway component GspD/PulD (secretin)
MGSAAFGAVVAAGAGSGEAPDPDAPPRISLAIEDLDVRAALALVAALAGVELEVSPWVQGRVSLAVEAVGWRRALEQLAVQVGEVVVRGHGDVVVVEPCPLLVAGEVVEVGPAGLVLRPDEGGETLTLTRVVPPAGAQDAAHEALLEQLLAKLSPGQRVSATCFPMGEQRVLVGLAMRLDD